MFAATETLSAGLINGLAVFYLLCAAMNVGFAAYYHCYSEPRRRDIAVVWYAVAALFALHAVLYFAGVNLVLPKAIREAVDWATGPISYTVLSMVAFAALIYWRKFFVQPQVAWAALMITLLMGGWSFT